MNKPRIGVIVFPGSNCDHDTEYALSLAGAQPVMVWHQDSDLPGLSAVVLPGGFSYGDYLRTGAVARFSPVMGAVSAFASSGGLVLGICNGFQILLEAGLLPGAMLRNCDLKFLCHQVTLRVESASTPFTSDCVAGDLLRVPIAHHDGNYYADPGTLAEIEANDQVIFRYATASGEIDPAACPNGSANNIAGIVNKERNVLGMMPHPERAAEELLGSTDGMAILRSFVSSAAQRKEVVVHV